MNGFDIKEGVEGSDSECGSKYILCEVHLYVFLLM